MKSITRGLQLACVVLGATFSAMASAAVAPTEPTYPLVTCPDSVANPDGAIAPSVDHVGDTDRLLVQNAIDAFHGSAGTVSLKAGLFMIRSALKITPGITLCAPHGTTLQWVNPVGVPNIPGRIIEPNTDQDGAVSGINIYNITFDHGGIGLYKGQTINIKSNVFKNINSSLADAKQGTYGWFGIHLVEVSGVTVSNNIFKDIFDGGIAAWDLKTSNISNNWFNRVHQPVSTVNAESTTFDSNVGYAIDRMAIEMTGRQMVGTPSLDHPNIVVTNNRFSNWVRYDRSACVENCAALSNAHEIIAISVVSSTGAKIKGNVLDCGTGCVGSDVGWGIEFSSFGVAEVSGNTIRGFRQGIVSHRGETMKIWNNSLVDVVTGIATTASDKAYFTKSLSIDGNQIESATSSPNMYNQWGQGIAVQWDRATAPVVSNNLITYKVDATKDVSGGTFTAIGVSPVDAGKPAGKIIGNKIIFDGPTVPGLQLVGFFLGGASGSLSGFSLDGNWVAALGSQNGVGVHINSSGVYFGVNFLNNRFQNLSKLTDGDSSLVYSAASKGKNWAINMTPTPGTPSTTANGDTSLTTSAQTKSIVLPSVALSSASNPVVVYGTPVNYTFSAAIGASPSSVFTPFMWYLGNGATAGSVKSVTAAYKPGATRIARALVKDPSGALVVKSIKITQVP
jgi:hypothetical protein